MPQQGVSKMSSEAFDMESKSNSPVEIDKNLLEDIIGTVSQSDSLAESLDTKNDHVSAERTNEVDNSDQTNSKKSRELKLLLALSKEANLNTNILHKRKSLEGSKTKVKDNSKTVGTPPEGETKRIPKVALESKSFRYPVTAESELELDTTENGKKPIVDNSNKVSKRKREELNEVSVGGATDEFVRRTKKPLSSDMARFKENKDIFCWRCHRDGVNIACETCPRSYHQKCLKQTISDTEHWPCPECVSILKAESTQTRSAAMKGMTLEHLCSLLKFAVNRMIQCQGSEPFLHPVNDNEFPDYKDYIVQPMDLTKMEKNIKGNLYGSTEAFEADAKWLLHNSIIYNSCQSKLTSAAKTIIKICKQEMAEIENCPSCYLNANTKKDTWFVEVCPKPHILVWAKLKGFPFWPAKAMCANSTGMVDVRFFGAHDRAWVHYKECYLFSEKDPNTFKQKRYDIEKCVEELNIYIENLKKKYGEFRYAPYKTLFDPENEIRQLQIFLPKYKAGLPKKRHNKSDSENSLNDFKNEKEETSNTEDKEDNQRTLDKETNLVERKCEFPNKNSETEHATVLSTEGNESDINQNGRDLNINGCNTNYNHGKFNDDSIMEGYGTDDDANTEIDLEGRKRFIDRNIKKVTEQNNEVMQDEEEEDDTQVPSNISVDNSSTNEEENMIQPRSIADNIQILASRLSDPNYNSKRRSCEDISLCSQKVARRNSDISVKSDSLILPSISEKINRVDISENMEVTLGNDDLGCISISENISSNSSDSEASKSGSEQNKRKPVQVDIENAEFTISPTNKLKISDALIKRLSDSDTDIISNPKIEEIKKNIVDKKSPTDILIEKLKHVVEREVVDFNKPSTSYENDNSSSILTSMDDKTRSASPIPTEKSKDVEESEYNHKTEPDKIIDEVDKTKDTVDDDINLPKRSENLAVKPKQVAPGTKSEEVESKQSDKINKVIIDNPESKENSQPPAETSKQPKTLIQPSVTEYIFSSKERSGLSFTKTTGSNEEDNSKDTNKAKDETKNCASVKKKSINSRVMNIIEEFNDVEEEEEALDDLQIDKNNIFNIIHSSLNESKEIAQKDNRAHNTISNNTLKIFNRKRKVTSNECAPTQAKMVKLVPIESILNKSQENEICDSPLLQKSLQGKKMIRKVSSSTSTPISSVSEESSVQEIMTEDIKSEPESDDDFSESENLEAKRQYLSALNISEKVIDTDKKKTNEIRTRSKTEEKREKFKKLDNLSRIIDDVALNYSANKEKNDLCAQKYGTQRNATGSHEGEIFVKSFAKIPYKPKARKSFPTPSYFRHNLQTKPNNISVLKKDNNPNVTLTKDLGKNNISANSVKVTSNNSVATTSQSIQPTETQPNAAVSHVIIFPPNQTINYGTPVGNPMLTVVSPVVTTTATTNSNAPPLAPLPKTTLTIPNTTASQNYIPLSEGRLNSFTGSKSNNVAAQSTVTTREAEQSREPENNTINASVDVPQEDEFTVLNNLLPESVSRAVSDLLLRPPPRLKPRPPGPLSTVFEEGVPSSAGNVAAKINSVAHRLGDYFRGMLIETLEDLGKSSTPEARITSLQLEIEAIKHRHGVEMSEIRKNICTILKDIQKSIVEDRERIIDETRAACEAETIKRVEMAKSKQWCVSCSKEAQFYCCWNTSYCDYPCQQKHWPQHVGKCTQNIEKNNNSPAPSNRPTGQQLILRPAVPPKPAMGRIVAKPTKVYMNRNTATSKTFKTLTTTGNHLTVIETTPGNYELVGNGPIAVSGKLLTSSAGLFHPKYKTANVVSVTSPSISGSMDQRNVHKTNNNSDTSKSLTPVSSITTVLDNDSE